MKTLRVLLLTLGFWFATASAPAHDHDTAASPGVKQIPFHVHHEEPSWLEQNGRTIQIVAGVVAVAGIAALVYLRRRKKAM